MSQNNTNISPNTLKYLLLFFSYKSSLFFSYYQAYKKSYKFILVLYLKDFDAEKVTRVSAFFTALTSLLEGVTVSVPSDKTTPSKV